MPASRFAAWAGTFSKAGVTRVTGVTNTRNPSISTALEPAAEVTQALPPRVTRVTPATPNATSVTLVTQRGKPGLPENRDVDQRGNPGNPGNLESGHAVAVYRDFYEERAAHWEFDAQRPRSEAERLAWGEAQWRWHKTHGERVSRELCTGCRRPIGTEAALDLIDDNRVHDRAGNDCLIRHGERWRAAATRALVGMGLQPPAGYGASLITQVGS